MKIALISDAWRPQRNGVVRVLDCLCKELEADGHEVAALEPGGFRTVACPTYPEIPLALFPGRRVAAWLEATRADAIHIATEGPLGWAARSWCLRNKIPFTTAYHTKFPQYVSARTKLPLPVPVALIRRFHRPSAGVLVPSPSVLSELDAWRFRNLRQWGHGVDPSVFRPVGKAAFDHLPRPVFLYVGRVTVDKNLPAFLDLDLPGTKVVVGDGPSRVALMPRYPDARFFIAEGDGQLASYFSAADCFVFPSRTDTFGLVMLEALACGVPVAAFPVAGPLDVIGQSPAGVLSENLAGAAMKALAIDPQHCLDHAARFSWKAVSRCFLDNLAPFDRR